MTIEEFEQKAEEINGKGEWFRVVYHFLIRGLFDGIIGEKDA